MNACGAALPLSREIVVTCDLGDHMNMGFHEGNLGREWVRWRARWNPINGGGPTSVQLVPVRTPPETP